MTLKCEDIIQNVLNIANIFFDKKNFRNCAIQNHFEKPWKKYSKKGKINITESIEKFEVKVIK